MFLIKVTVKANESANCSSGIFLGCFLLTLKAQLCVIERNSGPIVSVIDSLAVVKAFRLSLHPLQQQGGCFGGQRSIPQGASQRQNLRPQAVVVGNGFAVRAIFGEHPDAEGGHISPTVPGHGAIYHSLTFLMYVGDVLKIGRAHV